MKLLRWYRLDICRFKNIWFQSLWKSHSYLTQFMVKYWKVLKVLNHMTWTKPTTGATLWFMAHNCLGLMTSLNQKYIILDKTAQYHFSGMSAVGYFSIFTHFLEQEFQFQLSCGFICSEPKSSGQEDCSSAVLLFMPFNFFLATSNYRNTLSQRISFLFFGIFIIFQLWFFSVINQFSHKIFLGSFKGLSDLFSNLLVLQSHLIVLEFLPNCLDPFGNEILAQLTSASTELCWYWSFWRFHR